MRCRYRFPVKGHIQLNQMASIPSTGLIYEFELDNNFLKNIIVTIPLTNPEHWPKVQRSLNHNLKLEIYPNLETLIFLKKKISTLQGLLSLFGLYSIEFEEFEVEWLPDTEEEKANLDIFSMAKKRKLISESQFPPIPFDILARAVLAIDIAKDIEVPMNFYRRGMLDLYESNYIEAIYDFYFIIETTFAGGKFKQTAVIEAFRNSPDLCNYIRRAISDPGPCITEDQKLKGIFDNCYGNLTIENIIKKIVKLRGYLHHHTQKSQNMWHPEDQSQLELDALFLQAIAFNITFGLSEKFLWDETVIRAYKAIISN